MKIYTRGGDRGETGLLGGNRVPKTDPRVEAYGSVDELNAGLGLALALDGAEGEGGLEEAERGELRRIQEDLFAIGARLAAADPARARERGTIPELPAGRIEALERRIDRVEGELPPLDAFVLPGGSPVGAQLHVARTVCRRAERAIVRLGGDQPELEEAVIPYVNRLSDLLFTLARAANRRAGRPEARWAPRRERHRPAGETDGDPAGDTDGSPAGEAKP